jgi:hypothetical protein
MTPQTACIARWQWFALRNLAHGAWARQKRDVVAVLAGGGFLVIYEAHTVHSELCEAAPFLVAHWRLLLAGAGALSGAAGWWRGMAAARGAWAQLSAPWLAVLPLTADARVDAMRVGCVLQGLAQAAAVMALAALLASWAETGPMLAASLGGALAFTGAYGAAVVLRGNSRMERDFSVRDIAISTRAGRRVATLMARIDGVRPARVGTWAVLSRGGGFYAGSMAAGLAMAAVGCAIGAAQLWPFAAVAGAALGGHLVFVGTVDCRPLLNPVLRVAPLGFAPAAAATLRGPLAAACAVGGAGLLLGTATAGVPAGMAASGAAVMLVLNAVFASVACGLPASRGGAVALYGAAMLLTAYEHIEYGDAIYLCPAALAVFMCRQGRRGFRHFA